jgi:uncharacterized damage-inducible protein DinB
MTIGQSMLAEFDQEMAGTRKTLERVPDDKMTFQPHPKSFPMGSLARLVAGMPAWLPNIIHLEQWDLAEFGGYPDPKENHTKDLLAMFDNAVTEGRKALEDAHDDAMQQPWSLLTHGNAMFTMPRIMVLRSMLMNHMIHHRAQLGVYLRLCDIAVPALYGPSGDENS